MIDLANRHIFIAGGSRGIGAAAARFAAMAGADVSVNYLRDHESAARVVAEVEAEGRRGFAVQADISVDCEADRAIDEAVAKLGPLRGLIVSAGIFEGAPLHEMSTDFWDR